MYCHECGKPNPPRSNFCHDCGTVVTEPGIVGASRAPRAAGRPISRWPQLAALLGGALLFTGVFAPAYSVTIVNMRVTFDFFNGGRGDGTLLLGLAVLAAIVAFFRKYWWVLAAGTLSLVVLVIDLADANNGWSASFLAVFSYEWGSAILVVGAVVLLAVPFIDKIQAANSGEIREMDTDVRRTRIVDDDLATDVRASFEGALADIDAGSAEHLTARLARLTDSNVSISTFLARGPFYLFFLYVLLAKWVWLWFVAFSLLLGCVVQLAIDLWVRRLRRGLARQGNDMASRDQSAGRREQRLLVRFRQAAVAEVVVSAVLVLVGGAACAAALVGWVVHVMGLLT